MIAHVLFHAEQGCTSLCSAVLTSGKFHDWCALSIFHPGEHNKLSVFVAATGEESQGYISMLDL